MCFTLCNMKPCVRLSVPEIWSKNGHGKEKKHIKKKIKTLTRPNWSSKYHLFWLGVGHGEVAFKKERGVYITFGVHICICNFTLHRGIWIIYLATIQLGTSLIFTFYHQGHWMNLHSNLTYDTSSVLTPPPPPPSTTKCSQAGKMSHVTSMFFDTPWKTSWWMNTPLSD